MTAIDLRYEGDLRTRCVHRDNKAEIITDAPKDNQGLGREFSPTDLVAAALGSCVLTLIGIAARKLKIDVTGTQAEVIKEMQTAPSRRIGQLTVNVTCPHHFDETITRQLVMAAETCPVHHSLHPDIRLEFHYQWA